MEILRVENLSKAFKKFKVIDDITLSFEKNEIFTLMGQSGTGKSVFLKLVLGLLKPDRGRIIFQGEEITHASDQAWIEIRKEMGMLFQNGALFDSLNVFENVSFLLTEHLNISHEEKVERVYKLLMEVGLKGIEELYPSELSGGMQKRVALARTIALNPALLFYDEPITGLDPITSSVIIRLIRELNKKNKITSIIVSHSIKTSLEISDRLGLLYRGKLVALEEAEDIKNSKNKYLKQFIEGSTKGPIEVFLEETV